MQNMAWISQDHREETNVGLTAELLECLIVLWRPGFLGGDQRVCWKSSYS